MLLDRCLLMSVLIMWCMQVVCFFVNETSTPEIYTYLHTLSLHDALPICRIAIGDSLGRHHVLVDHVGGADPAVDEPHERAELHPHHFDQPDRKSTRLNSSH